MSIEIFELGSAPTPPSNRLMESYLWLYKALDAKAKEFLARQRKVDAASEEWERLWNAAMEMGSTADGVRLGLESLMIEAKVESVTYDGLRARLKPHFDSRYFAYLVIEKVAV